MSQSAVAASSGLSVADRFVEPGERARRRIRWLCGNGNFRAGELDFGVGRFLGERAERGGGRFRPAGGAPTHGGEQRELRLELGGDRGIGEQLLVEVRGGERMAAIELDLREDDRRFVAGGVRK